MADIEFSFGVYVSENTDPGMQPGVAMDKQGNILTVYCSDTDQLIYQVGQVEKESESSYSSTWNDDAHKFDKKYGSLSGHPDLAMDDEGNCVCVFASDGDGYCTLGKFDGTKVIWNTALKFASDIDNPTVSMNASGQVVALYEHGDDVLYRTGYRADDQVEWNSSHTAKSDRSNPGVAIGDDNVVIAVFASNADLLPSVYWMKGYLDPDDHTQIIWHADDRWSKGRRPAVATNNDLVLSVHTDDEEIFAYYSSGHYDPGNTFPTVDWGDFENGGAVAGFQACDTRADGLAIVLYFFLDPTSGNSSLMAMLGMRDS